MATHRSERGPATGDDDDGVARLRVALRWAGVYEYCCCNPVDDWSNAEPPAPGGYRALADHWLARVSEIVGYEVDGDEAARLWSDL